jgi:hypothetical protein
VLDEEEGEDREREREVEGERDRRLWRRRRKTKSKLDSSILLLLIVFFLFVRRNFLTFSNIGFEWNWDFKAGIGSQCVSLVFSLYLHVYTSSLEFKLEKNNCTHLLV